MGDLGPLARGAIDIDATLRQWRDAPSSLREPGGLVGWSAGTGELVWTDASWSLWSLGPADLEPHLLIEWDSLAELLELPPKTRPFHLGVRAVRPSGVSTV